MKDITVEGQSVRYTGFVNGFKTEQVITFHFHNPVDAKIFASAFDNVTGVEIKQKG